MNYYDSNGNVVKTINRKYNGVDTTDRYIINEYDQVNRLIATRSQIAEEGGLNVEQVTVYGYDAAGNRTSVSANGLAVSRTTYDRLGRAVETVQPSGRIVGSGYDFVS